MARRGSIVGRTCYYCLCRVCNRIQCPRGRYHCLPCYHGQILDCDFFMHKKVSKVYRIKHRSHHVSVEDLTKIREVLNQILDDNPDPEPTRFVSLKTALAEEEQRHKAALRDIMVKAQNGDFTVK